LFKSIGMKK